MFVTILDAATRGAAQETGGPSPEKANKSRAGERLYILDLLRFSAAILVLAFHLMPVAMQAYHSYLFGHFAYQVSRYGWMGVDLFFIISGFVICMSAWGRTTSQFFVSRTTRLMPAYLLTVPVAALLLTLFPATPESPAPPLSQVLANLTMTQGLLAIPHLDGVFWTLTVELKFYIIFAIVVYFGLNYRRVVAFCLLWTTLSLFGQLSKERILTSILEPQYASHFVAGITLYLIYRFGPNLLLWCMLSTSWVYSVLSAKVVVDQRIAKDEPVNLTVATTLMTVFYLIMVGVALGWFSWVRWRGLVIIGALTYPVYLLHNSIGPVAIRRLSDNIPAWPLVIGVLAMILLAGYLVNRFVERPGAKFMRRGLLKGFEDIRRDSQGNGPGAPGQEHPSATSGPTGTTPAATPTRAPQRTGPTPFVEATPDRSEASAPAAAESALTAPTVVLPTFPGTSRQSGLEGRQR